MDYVVFAESTRLRSNQAINKNPDYREPYKVFTYAQYRSDPLNQSTRQRVQRHND